MQKIYMDWNQLLLSKEDWQKKTFEKIKSRLISAKDNRFIRYDNSEETYLVMIYGKSQVGKTTLILNMIGIKDECLNDVYITLRAGISRGNSSTSTAIIYSRSDSDMYGCMISKVNGLPSKEFVTYDKKEMIHRLEGIRRDVENNKYNVDDVLSIFIPKKYFSGNAVTRHISIMDMPGIESKNHKEDIHVRSLMTKYIPLSSVCVIACRSNDIVSLGTEQLPNVMEWKRMPHRFIVVLTHSYNDAGIKKYFKDEKIHRKKDFYNYVKDTYIPQVREILGEGNKIEIYPVDVGDTLQKLCDSEIKNVNDKKEIIDAKNRILFELRQSIENRKGERLKSALKDLEETVKSYGIYEIDNIKDNISCLKEKSNNKQKEIKKAEKGIIDYKNSGEKEKMESEIEFLESVRNEINNCRTPYLHNLYSHLEEYVNLNSYIKNSSKGKYLRDKKSKVLDWMLSYIVEQRWEEWVNFCKIFDKLSEFKEYKDEKKRLQKPEPFDMSIYIMDYKSRLYPQKEGLFSKRETVYLEEVKSICEKIQKNINQRFDLYIDECLEIIGEIILKKEKKLDENERAIHSLEKEVDINKNYMLNLENQIQKLYEKEKIIEKKKQNDRETLNMYLKFAEEAYLEQRNDIVSKINSNRKSTDKMKLILSLGLLDEDYIKVTGGINET